MVIVPLQNVLFLLSVTTRLICHLTIPKSPVCLVAHKGFGVGMVGCRTFRKRGIKEFNDAHSLQVSKRN